MALVISFVLELEGLTEGVIVMSFHYGGTQANGVIHGERSTGVGSDGMIGKDSSQERNIRKYQF